MLVDAVPAALERGRSQIGKGLERLVAQGEARRRGPRRGARPPGDRAATSPPSREADLVVEAVVERLDVKRKVLAELDRICPPATILATNTSSISITKLAARHPAAGQGDRHALHEPRAGDAARRGHPRPRHQPGDLRRRRGGLAQDGQDAGRGARRPRLRLQPRADADDQRGDLLPLRGGREGRGHRRGYEARDESSDGTAGPRRPDRPRRLPRHPAGAAGGVRRSQVPPLPAAGQDGRRRPPGPQVGPGLLRVRSS